MSKFAQEADQQRGSSRPSTIADEQASAFEADRKRAGWRFSRINFALPLLRN